MSAKILYLDMSLNVMATERHFQFCRLKKFIRKCQSLGPVPVSLKADDRKCVFLWGSQLTEVNK